MNPELLFLFAIAGFVLLILKGQPRVSGGYFVKRYEHELDERDAAKANLESDWEAPWVSIEAIDVLDEQVTGELKASLKGKVVNDILYVKTNYPDRPLAFDGFHLSDTAILIKFSDNTWLNWVWTDDGFYGRVEFNISLIDVTEILGDEFTKVIGAVDFKEWKGIADKTVKKVDVGFSEINGETFLSSLQLTFNTQTVSILAIEEPDPYALPELRDLRLGNDWTIVVFDESILDKMDG